MENKKISQLESILEYSFKDKSLLVTALTHSSYANEHFPKQMHNQRLEFLGDAVLDLIVGLHIYNQNPDMQEGELTKLRASLVCENTLYNVAMELSLNNYLKLGVGQSQNLRKSILADSFESVVAAIFMDGGFDVVKEFIGRQMTRLYKYGSNSGLKINYKTELQERFAKTGETVSYTITDVKGPEHDCIYTAKVSVAGRYEASGEGHTKKEAEQDAAKSILEKLSKT